MPRSMVVSTYFVLTLAIVAGCGSRTLGTDGAAGGSAAGAGGGAAGDGGGAGAGGAGGATLASCPTTTRPTTGTACAGSFTCNYTDAVRCNVSCYSAYMCSSGKIIFLGNNDGCFQVTCSPDAGTDAADARMDAADARADATTATVCTPGAHQSCNDNPAWSSIHGSCTDAGVCVCSDAGTNPDSGRCL